MQQLHRTGQNYNEYNKVFERRLTPNKRCVQRNQLAIAALQSMLVWYLLYYLGLCYCTTASLHDCGHLEHAARQIRQVRRPVTLDQASTPRANSSPYPLRSVKLEVKNL